jgi:hypothetical protein
MESHLEPTFLNPDPIPSQDTNGAIAQLEYYKSCWERKWIWDRRISQVFFTFLLLQGRFIPEVKKCWIGLWVERNLNIASPNHTHADLRSWCRFMQRVILEWGTTERMHDIWLDGKLANSEEILRLSIPIFSRPILPQAHKKEKA